MSEPEPELLSTREAAALLGLSKIRILQFIRDGRLPAMRIGGSRMYLIKRGDLDKVERHESGAHGHKKNRKKAEI